MRLGKHNLAHPLFMAPMSGITDTPFRQLVLEKGCALVFTEMVSAEGLIRKDESFLNVGKEEHPLSVQLFGSDPEVLARAAERVEAMGADAIDINMGCPAKKVIGTGAGVDLMRFPEKVEKILMHVRRAVTAPLTIKIRAGWDKERINAVEIAKIAEDCGVDAITIHPRTKIQGFAGRADWTVIGALKKAVTIPVIGNGDVTTPALAKRMMEETGCDGVMIGRGALGNPWIFRQEEGLPFPSLKERQEVIQRHFSLMQNHYGEKGAVKEMRKHVIWYTRGLPFSASIRSKLARLRERETLFEAITSYFDFIQEHRSIREATLPPLFDGRYCRGSQEE
ncbi:MAG: tRNA dihydrouridine synthase DusB [Deltaproteobacteria bacterium]